MTNFGNPDRIPEIGSIGQNGDFTAVFPLIVRETGSRREVLTPDGRVVSVFDQTHKMCRKVISRESFDALVGTIANPTWWDKRRNEILWEGMVLSPEA